MKKFKKNTGDNIAAENANWKFSGNVVKKFDSHVKKSVPLYLSKSKLYSHISLPRVTLSLSI